MQQPAPQTLAIGHPSDVPAARRAAKLMAESLGFDPEASEEIGLAVSELASNLCRHASGGTLELTPAQEANRCVLAVESVDEGPGIPDVELAQTDGYSTAGSLGYGLGVVNRLMDELEIMSRPGSGTRIACRRWLRERATGAIRCPIAFGVATRAHPRMGANGDAFAIRRWKESALVAVIDGLGHGQFAHRAAQAARSYVEDHYDQPLAAIFRGTERACRATRGVVMALARFDWGQGRMSFASIGNIEARVLGASESINFHIRRGVLGGGAPSPVVTEHPWQTHYLLVLHTDGLRSSWSWKDFPDLHREPASRIAQRLLRVLAKDEDDATVVVAGEGCHER